MGSQMLVSQAYTKEWCTYRSKIVKITKDFHTTGSTFNYLHATYGFSLTFDLKSTLISLFNVICHAESFPTICQSSEVIFLNVEDWPQSLIWALKKNYPPIQFRPCPCGVQGHWQTLWQLLHKYQCEGSTIRTSKE